MDHDDLNRASYADAEVVTHYATRTDLYPAEEELLRDCPPLRSLDVLDLGIGGGRTTRHLAPEAGHYVGIDFIPEMVSAAAAATDHQWDLRVGDAADLSAFGDASFDLVVFSFNGIATLPTTEARRRCLSEVHRVLRPGGRFLFSLGNAGFVKTPDAHPSNLRVRLRSALGYAHHARRLIDPVLWRGQGWHREVILDGTELHTFWARPRFVEAELVEAGFALDRRINGLFPRDLRSHQTPWWYYLASRS